MTVKRSNQTQATASVARIGNKNILNRRVRRSRHKINYGSGREATWKGC